jgi:hypothetical protein
MITVAKNVSWVLIACCVTNCARSGRVVTNEEFGFTAAIPHGFPVCYGDSGTHVHGVGTVLDGGACDGGGPALSVWADYNTYDAEDPAALLPDECQRGTTDEGWYLGDLPTTSCQIARPDGSVQLILVAQGAPDPDERVPVINYTVSLATTRARLAKDIELFRAFVASVRIAPPSRQ